MATRTCPNCGAPDYGTPHCVSCQKPFLRDRGAGLAEASRPAGFFRRLPAFLFDVVLLSIVADMVRFSFGIGAGSEAGTFEFDIPMAISLTVAVIYFTIFTAEGGQTIGKRIFRIKVVLQDGRDATMGVALLRTVGYLLSSFFGTFLGFLWAIWDRRHQAWHDKLAGTVVVRI